MKRIVIGAGILLMLCLAGWWYYTTHVSPVPASEDVSLRLKWAYSTGFAGAIMGVEQGYFSDNGINLTIEPGGLSLDPIALVAQGTDDIGISGADRFLQGIDRGLPLVAIALETRHSFVCFLSLANSNITAPTDFAGRRVGVFKDDTYTVYRAMLARAGVDARTVEEVPVGYDLVPLLEGIVEVYPAYIINQPPRLSEMGIEYNIIRPSDYGVDFAGNVYFTTSSLVEEQPAVVEGFLRGLTRGWEYALAHPGQVLDVVMREEPSLDRGGEDAVLAALIEELSRSGRRLLLIEPSDLEDTQQAMYEQGLIKNRHDLSAVVASGFMESIHAEQEERGR